MELTQIQTNTIYHILDDLSVPVETRNRLDEFLTSYSSTDEAELDQIFMRYGRVHLEDEKNRLTNLPGILTSEEEEYLDSIQQLLTKFSTSSTTVVDPVETLQQKFYNALKSYYKDSKPFEKLFSEFKNLATIPTTTTRPTRIMLSNIEPLTSEEIFILLSILKQNETKLKSTPHFLDYNVTYYDRMFQELHTSLSKKYYHLDYNGLLYDFTKCVEVCNMNISERKNYYEQSNPKNIVNSGSLNNNGGDVVPTGKPPTPVLPRVEKKAEKTMRMTFEDFNKTSIITPDNREEFLFELKKMAVAYQADDKLNSRINELESDMEQLSPLLNHVFYYMKYFEWELDIDFFIPENKHEVTTGMYEVDKELVAMMVVYYDDNGSLPILQFLRNVAVCYRNNEKFQSLPPEIVINCKKLNDIKKIVEYSSGLLKKITYVEETKDYSWKQNEYNLIVLQFLNMDNDAVDFILYRDFIDFYNDSTHIELFNRVKTHFNSEATFNFENFLMHEISRYTRRIPILLFLFLLPTKDYFLTFSGSELSEDVLTLRKEIFKFILAKIVKYDQEIIINVMNLLINTINKLYTIKQKTEEADKYVTVVKNLEFENFKDFQKFIQFNYEKNFSTIITTSPPDNYTKNQRIRAFLTKYFNDLRNNLTLKNLTHSELLTDFEKIDLLLPIPIEFKNVDSKFFKMFVTVFSSKIISPNKLYLISLYELMFKNMYFEKYPELESEIKTWFYNKTETWFATEDSKREFITLMNSFYKI